MIDVQEVKTQILDFIEKSGPTIPVKIAREVKMEPVWASAILAELVNSKKLLMSSMKIGSSPYYFKPGQEAQLAPLADNVLTGTPKEVFVLLHEKKVLKDNDQEPQIRVALRSLKDFATPFDYEDETYWRYNFVSKSEIHILLSRDKIVSNIKDSNITNDIHEEVTVQSFESKRVEEEQEIENIFDSKDDIDLIEKVRAYLDKKNILILEETDIKKKEFMGIGRMQTEIGEIELTIIAKDKKNIIDKDIEKAYSLIEEKKMFVLFLTTGKIAKKAKDFYREHKNIIRIEKLE